LAYQGLGRNLDEDAEAIRCFMTNGIEMLIAVSNAKNFGLYGERTGCLYIVSETPKIAQHITSFVKLIIRTMYSTPPMHGAKIAAHILSTPSLREKWLKELQEMKSRIDQARLDLFERLAAKGKAKAFEQLTRGRGMFGYTGLSSEQVERMIAEYGIYMVSDGRVNVCGLNESNIDYVADAILSVMG
jgi:aromatic-amino-acid transaminase